MFLLFGGVLDDDISAHESLEVLCAGRSNFAIIRFFMDAMGA